MAFDSVAVIVLLALLAAGMLWVGVELLRRRAATDPAIPLLQQQISHLANQVAGMAGQVPREVGNTLTPLLGQVNQGLLETARVLQKASADTGRLIADVNVRLGELAKGNQQILALGQDIRGLQQIFQAPKVRGGLGETALQAMLEQVFPADHFALQFTFRDGEMVDAILRLPGGLVPIDSKFPLTGFQSVIDAATDEDRVRARRSFARDVRKHVDDIARKYIRPAEGTLDFALMYIPAENVYYETIVRDAGGAPEEEIAAAALRKKVVPVSPNTLYAYLRAIASGLMGLKIEERARDILRGLQALQADLGKMQESFSLGQKHLRNAAAAFEEGARHLGRVADRVDQFAQAAGVEGEAVVLPGALDGAAPGAMIPGGAAR